jgi:hypothetical protein
MTSHTPLLILHLLGCAFGIGGSTMLDLQLLRLLRGQRVTTRDLNVATVLSHFVKIGLALLWLSGLGLLLRLYLTAPDLLANPKLHAKIAIVVVLTLNGVLIETIALPILRQQQGRPLFEGVNLLGQNVMLIIGAVSAMSWYTPFVLGIARELNFGPAIETILIVYVAAVGACVVGALAWRMLFYRPSDPDRIGDALRAILRERGRTVSRATRTVR